MRISDWSSDVCSSDLVEPGVQARGFGLLVAGGGGGSGGGSGVGVGGRLIAGDPGDRQSERQGDGEGIAGERGAHDWTLPARCRHIVGCKADGGQGYRYWSVARETPGPGSSGALIE